MAQVFHPEAADFDFNLFKIEIEPVIVNSTDFEQPAFTVAQYTWAIDTGADVISIDTVTYAATGKVVVTGLKAGNARVSLTVTTDEYTDPLTNFLVINVTEDPSMNLVFRVTQVDIV